MPKDKDNKVQKEEKIAEQQAEAAEVPASADASSTNDEEAVKAGEVEKEVGAQDAMPAEVAAINTDNQTAIEATQAASAETKPAPSGKFAEIIKQIENLKVAELADLVKALEERFGVSAAAPMPVASQSTGAGQGSTAPVEEKSVYTVLLADSGAQKIAVIKAVRELRQDLGLKEAKDLVDSAPKELMKEAKKEEAEAAKAKLEAVGAKVELI